MTALASDRMRAACLKAHLQEAGFDPSQLMYAAEFLRAFSELNFPYPDESISAADGEQAVTVWLGHTEGEAFFWRDVAGDIHIDITKFGRFDGTEHIYINFVILVMLRYHPKLAFLVDVDALDAFLGGTEDVRTVRLTYLAFSLFSHFAKLNTGNDLGAHCGFPFLTLDMPSRLFTRVGPVELTAVRAILEESDILEEECRRIAANMDSEAFMYGPPASTDTNRRDLGYAIRLLMTNAGMYAETAEGLASSLRDWARRYIAGMTGGSELYLHVDGFMQSHLTRTVALGQGIQFEPRRGMRFGHIPDFYRQLAGRTVLMVSPFALACEEAVSSGRIRRLWKNIEVPEFRLVPLQAFVTTYPNRPHGSWSETFAELCRGVDEIVAREQIDLVLGSCGCYGLPLMAYCHRRYGVSAVYYGNLTNMLFGVKLNDFAGYFADSNLGEWVEPTWGWAGALPANLDRIDGGRYIMDAATSQPVVDEQIGAEGQGAAALADEAIVHEPAEGGTAPEARPEPKATSAGLLGWLLGRGGADR